MKQQERSQQIARPVVKGGNADPAQNSHDGAISAPHRPLFAPRQSEQLSSRGPSRPNTFEHEFLDRNTYEVVSSAIAP
jgi:hypothetical protein